MSSEAKKARSDVRTLADQLAQLVKQGRALGIQAADVLLLLEGKVDGGGQEVQRHRSLGGVSSAGSRGGHMRDDKGHVLCEERKRGHADARVDSSVPRNAQLLELALH